MRTATVLRLLLAMSLTTAGSVAVTGASASGDGVAVSTPVEDPYYPAKGDPGVDALRYRLDLRWSPRRERLEGTATITLRSTQDQASLTLDLSRRLVPHRTTVDDVAVPVTHVGDHLALLTGPVAADSRHVVTIHYSGSPRPADAPTQRSDLRRVGWTTTRSGGVWTMQEPFGAFTWYPVNDHPSDKALYDIRVDVPDRFVGVSNGRLVARRVADGRTITRWRMSDPAASYLVTLAVGDYVRVRDHGPGGLPVAYWVPRDDRSSLRFLRHTPAMIRWLQDRLGPYPFDRIGAVVVPSPSAMETQELVTMGADRLRSRRDALGVLLHEYAHQWYGDAVTPVSWPELWLNESFAMYIQIQWQIDRGWQTRREWLRLLRDLDGPLRAANGPPGAYHRGDFGGACTYYCGALMLFELRRNLGDEEFDGALRDWPQEYHGRNVDRSDYSSWLSARVGSDLEPFLTAWLTSPTTPTTT